MFAVGHQCPTRRHSCSPAPAGLAGLVAASEVGFTIVRFLAFLPQFVDASGGPVALQILVLGTLFTLLAVVSDGAYVLLAGAVGSRLRGGRRFARLAGGVYIGLGVGATQG